MINQVNNSSSITQQLQLNMDVLKNAVSQQQDMSQKVAEMNTQIKLSENKTAIQQGVVDLIA